jgi:serine/threonine-protein kinase
VLALAAAHEIDVIHRDLKPANIFLCEEEGQPLRVKLLDFGVAKLVGEYHREPALTGEGMLVGTLEYMAPEQLAGGPIDARGDIYALGVILLEMLLGRRPSMAECLSSSSHSGPLPGVQPGRAERAAARRLAAVAARCLRRDPAERYPDVRRLLDDLERVLGEPDGSRRRPRGRLVWLAMGAAVAAGSPALVDWGRPERTPEIARTPGRDELTRPPPLRTRQGERGTTAGGGADARLPGRSDRPGRTAADAPDAPARPDAPAQRPPGHGPVPRSTRSVATTTSRRASHRAPVPASATRQGTPALPAAGARAERAPAAPAANAPATAAAAPADAPVPLPAVPSGPAVPGPDGLDPTTTKNPF